MHTDSFLMVAATHTCRRARIEGSKTCVSFNSRLESKKEEEEDTCSIWWSRFEVQTCSDAHLQASPALSVECNNMCRFA